MCNIKTDICALHKYYSIVIILLKKLKKALFKKFSIFLLLIDYNKQTNNIASHSCYNIVVSLDEMYLFDSKKKKL